MNSDSPFLSEFLTGFPLDSSFPLTTMRASSQTSVTPSDDPLDEFLKPPPDETPEQAAIRLQREEQARQISQAIDASIKAERQARKKRRIVRLLLLGQSESGAFSSLSYSSNVTHIPVRREIYYTKASVSSF